LVEIERTVLPVTVHVTAVRALALRDDLAEELLKCEASQHSEQDPIRLHWDADVRRTGIASSDT
jgi:hypothetical protein